MKAFNLSDIELTKYLFFTGKGGVGKTSIACATAVGLADKGEKILLISTDPASNLQDVFNQTLNGHGTAISEVPGLTVVNLDPEQAAAEYRESVIAPFRGQLPESVIQNMEEQLSGSCTVEIAAFNEFQTLSPMLIKQRNTTTLFSIQHLPDTHCECCNFHQHGVHLLAKVHMAHLV